MGDVGLGEDTAFGDLVPLRGIVPEVARAISLNARNGIRILLPLLDTEVKHRAETLFRERGIATIADVVPALKESKDADVRECAVWCHVHETLRGRAVPIEPSSLASAVAPLLVQANSEEFVFDAYGVLRRIELAPHDRELLDALSSGSAASMDGTPSIRALASIYDRGMCLSMGVSQLGLRPAQTRALEAASIYTIEALVHFKRAELRARGCAPGLIDDIMGALGRWRGGELALGVDIQRLRDARRALELSALRGGRDAGEFLASATADERAAARRAVARSRRAALPVYAPSIWPIALAYARDARLRGTALNLKSRAEDACASIAAEALIWGSAEGGPCRVRLPEEPIWSNAARGLASSCRSIAVVGGGGHLGFCPNMGIMPKEVRGLSFACEEPAYWRNLDFTVKGDADRASNPAKGPVVVPAASLKVRSIPYGKVEPLDAKSAAEDRYAPLFREYEFDYEEFHAVTGLGRSAYDRLDGRYRRRTSKAKAVARLPLAFARNDRSLPSDLRQKIRAWVNGGSSAAPHPVR